MNIPLNRYDLVFFIMSKPETEIDTQTVREEFDVSRVTALKALKDLITSERLPLYCFTFKLEDNYTSITYKGPEL